MTDASNICEGLTEQEADFVMAVLHYPGAKRPYAGEYFPENAPAVWEKPENLGLVRAVGSYKWYPIDEAYARIRKLLAAPQSQGGALKLDGPIAWVKYDTSGLAFSCNIHVGEKKPEGERWKALYHVEPAPTAPQQAGDGLTVLDDAEILNMVRQYVGNATAYLQHDCLKLVRAVLALAAPRQPEDVGAGVGMDNEDSILTCLSDLEHSAIYDNSKEMPECIRAVVKRIRALLAASAAASHASCPAPLNEIESAEREHLGCAHCETGIYAASAQQTGGFSCAKRATDPQNELAACRQWCGDAQRCVTAGFDTAKFFRHVEKILAMDTEQREQSTFGAGDATPELMAAIRVVSEIEAKARKAASAQQDERDAKFFRWLTDDLAGDERQVRNALLERMAVMSYSAACDAIDAAIAESRCQSEQCKQPCERFCACDRKSASAQQDEREAFEAWAKIQPLPLSAWDAWQARAAMSREQSEGNNK